jgi:hypothetical protein
MKLSKEQSKNSRTIRKYTREMKEQAEAKVPKMRRVRQKLKGRVETPY